MAKPQKLTISVAATAEAHERKSAPLQPHATEIHGTGDWRGYLNERRDELVVRCKMAGGKWRVAYVSLDKLVDDVGRAMNDVGREGLL